VNGPYIAGFVTFVLVCVLDKLGPDDAVQGLFGFGMAVCLWIIGAAQDEVAQLRKERAELRRRVERHQSEGDRQSAAE